MDGRNTPVVSGLWPPYLRAIQLPPELGSTDRSNPNMTVARTV